ncbi:hypothetical protein TNCV_2607691 [Trichonephila clavipes]|uniref:Uncharacterized protein n=1 Tax=Trichonephila clavipes TaxID=2585209 RepID=A0A8X6RZC4_TRICX|nr:hypothetical protein TNCV_2607691 [Trichonephila clavipes]
MTQGHSYHRINDTEPPSYRAPTCVTTVPLTGLPYLNKGPKGILIQGPLRASYASAMTLTTRLPRPHVGERGASSDIFLINC